MPCTQQHPGRRSILLAIALVGGASLLARPVFAADPSADLTRLDGRYRFAGGDAERKALHDAIEDVLQGVGSIARPLVRQRLEEANPIPDELVLASDARTFTLAYAAERFVAPLDGSSVRVRTSSGDQLGLQVRFEKGTIRQHFSGDGKSRTNLLRREGDRLAVYVRVHADQLPKELVYRLTFAPG